MKNYSKKEIRFLKQVWPFVNEKSLERTFLDPSEIITIFATWKSRKQFYMFGRRRNVKDTIIK